jgi:hypothetical protein
VFKKLLEFFCRLFSLLDDKIPVRPFRATTIYILNGTLGTTALQQYLEANLPAIKANGFDTVYLPAVWKDFDPTPLTGPYNSTAFQNARAALATIDYHGMDAVIGLNYIGVGYAPDFGSVLPQDQACDWARTPDVYAAFERYAEQFMRELTDFNDMVYLMVFTESAEGCGLATPEAAQAVATRLRTTLGSLPSRMPASLRRKWRWGYHDYSIVNLGWGNGSSPIMSPNPFDFVSMVAYNVSDINELNTRAARFKALYDVPLMVGEAGANGCPGATPPQSTVDTQIVTWALDNGYGFNIWGWPNAGEAECTNVYGGYALTNQDGTPNEAALAIKAILTKAN